VTTTTAPTTSCPFCHLAPDQILFSSDLVIALWDAFPVSPGHTLLTPRRHIADWFDATPEEQAELIRAIDTAKATIERQYQPDGYNIGINIGRAAGQTVFHLHVHVIPRYTGDVPDPRGGVRHVIPAKGNYLVTPATPMPVASPDQPLIRGGTTDPLLPHLITQLDSATAVEIATAFTLESGVRLIEEHLRDVLDRGGRVRIITGDYLGVTEPAALLRLLDLQGDIQLRIYESGNTSFHPKAYIVTHADDEGIAFVGSSNLTRTALQRGVEWNYQVFRARDRAGFTDIVSAFDALWEDPRVKPLDDAWVHSYQARRAEPIARVAGIEAEPMGPPPTPHSIQREALAALEATRAEGNTAGLVVLATGLGKTWLSAFDSDRPEFRRILFIAHREEILTQAMRTFRAIRPLATLGYYTGAEKTPEADVVFASIQTLGHARHLRRFEPRQFDYIVVDEFHHAAARTYRNLIGYFEPRFLLGLTATPERTDGADLLSLCGNNLVYRRDLADGISRGLLAPFDYFGVPDEVDYSNIPWRSSRFDEEALTTAVATRARAENALAQYRRLARTRTIAFCVSQRHADFMAEYFRAAGLRAVAVHSGPSSAPRAHSLEQLEAGELDLIFAVDIFNEGIDLPRVDTILMLRPTESRILWLQQFGRGLRHQPGKTLQVIDYIGNHRVFLNKARALFNLGSGDREVAQTLDFLDAGTLELPPGCSVTYELEALEILRSLIRSTTSRGDLLREYYEDFRDRHGVRPLAGEAFEDGFDPGSARRSGYDSWLDFVHLRGDLTPEQTELRERFGTLLRDLEVTALTRSYKMLVLLATLGEDAFPGRIGIDRLTERFGELARRYAPLRTEVGDALDDPAALRRLIIKNPIAAWTGPGAGTGSPYFSYDADVLATTFSVSPHLREPLQDLVRELAEWRLAAYLRRQRDLQGADRILCNVSHADGRPVIVLPDRERHAGIPVGWREIVVDGEEYQANFGGAAVEIIARPGRTENALAEILRRWFGAELGRQGGTEHRDPTHDVVFERRGAGYLLGPARELTPVAGPIPWQHYTRKEAVDSLGLSLTGWEHQSGIVQRPGGLVLFVTLDKAGMDDAYQYRDHFLSPTEFQWQSQNRTRQASELGGEIRRHREKGIDVRLFVRRRANVRGETQPFYYCGKLDFVRWEGERPITVWWALEEGVPEGLWGELGVESER
jgi:superfamily II DNA or RNA helicase/diadenosine tetraphosphate (Ap4A) HIT family hydrolase/HKD family nuclease